MKDDVDFIKTNEISHGSIFTFFLDCQDKALKFQFHANYLDVRFTVSLCKNH